MTKMYNDFDPYEMLVQMTHRLNQIENAHNGLVNAFQKSEAELSVTMKSLVSLQQAHLQLSQNNTALGQALLHWQERFQQQEQAFGKIIQHYHDIANKDNPDVKEP
jgi:hypothetical protein